jgi:CBS-domain-containing membrane protein
MSVWVRLLAVVIGAAGGALAIGAMEMLSVASAIPLAAIPFATSIVLVLGTPDALPAQPRALVGGHLVSTLVGLAVLTLCGPAPWAAAVAVGLAMIAMHLTGTFHPPAGIDPLVVVVNNMPWSFLAVPVAAGALLLAAFAWIWHNYVWQGIAKSGHRIALPGTDAGPGKRPGNPAVWPARWW